jgi:hypothetical protein
MAPHDHRRTDPLQFLNYRAMVFSGANRFAEWDDIETEISARMPFSTPHNNIELLVGRKERDQLIRRTKMALTKRRRGRCIHDLE